jgi:hypothetical protein
MPNVLRTRENMRANAFPFLHEPLYFFKSRNDMKKLHHAVLIGLVLATGAARAEELSTIPGIYGGLGANYVTKLAPTVQSGKGTSATIGVLSLHSDDTILSPTKDSAETVVIGRTKSMGWNDPAVNPRSTKDNPITDPAMGYGWGHNSAWHLIDLNPLYAQGQRYLHVSVTVERYDDGVAQEPKLDSAGKPTTDAAGNPVFEPSDDDLIPGLTAWQGNQDTGKHMHWYPNQYQNWDEMGMPVAGEKIFWANKLSPASGEDGSHGWATAYFSAAQDSASVHVLIKLDKNPAKNFLTVALGGDARHIFPPGDAKQGQVDSSKKHDVNYKLTVEAEPAKPFKTAKAK